MLSAYIEWKANSKPDVSHFRVFGCTSYVNVKKDKRRPLQSHTQKCVFLGYPSNFKGWLFWNPITRKEIISDSAQFDERAFPGTSRTPVDLRVQTTSKAKDLPEQGGVDDDLDTLSPLLPTAPAPPHAPSSAPTSPHISPPASPSPAPSTTAQSVSSST